MGVKRSNSSARLLRRNSSTSFSGLTLGLDVERLEVVLNQLVPRYCRDGDLLTTVRLEGSRMVDRLWQMQGSRSNSNSRVEASSQSSCLTVEFTEILSNVLTILCSFLSSCTSNVPCVLVFDVHSLVGQIREGQRSYDSAIVSYLKALWIASSSPEIPREHLARTQHRIGQLYGRQGNWHEAKTLLLKALDNYQVAHVATDHPIVMEAMQSVREYETTSPPSSNWSSDDSWSSSRGGDKRPSLPLILEESELIA